MGIRFLCPNGHRLNVKAFLAGKKAVCPKCGEKVLVPTESDPNASKSRHGAAPVAPSPKDDKAETDIEVAANATVTEIAAAQPAAPVVASVSIPAASVSPIAADPLAEAPAAVWYVRPPSGGQYGPAPADVMRGWLSEGRVSGDSLVWRSDWPDWRSASITFTQLGGGATATMPQAVNPPAGIFVSPAPCVAPVQPVHPMTTPFATVVVPQSPMMTPFAPTGVPTGQAVEYAAFGESPTSPYDDPVSRTKRRRQKGADATMIVSGILVALVMILFVVLGIVLSQNSEEPATPRRKPKPKPSAAEVEPKRDAVSDDPSVQPLDEEPIDRPEMDEATEGN